MPARTKRTARERNVVTRRETSTVDGASPLALRHVPGAEHGYADVEGTRIHYTVAGHGEPIVLLHTFPQSWYAWRRVIPLLSDDHFVVCPDFRGAGASDAPARGYDTEQRAQDVLRLLDALGLDRVTLVGHGWGGWAGFRVCLRAPERISGFVSVGMTHPWMPLRAAIGNAWRQWHTAFWEYPLLGSQVLRRLPAFTRFVLRHWAHDPSVLSAEEVALYAEAVRAPARARAAQQLHWRYVVHDVPRLITGCRGLRLAVPTRILIGECDVVVRPGMARSSHRHAEDIQVTVVPEAGHLLPEERPVAVAAEIRDLIGVGN